MKSKALKLDAGSAKRYATALDLHILKALGDIYYDALRGRDVQEWVDFELMHGRIGVDGVRRPYGVQTVHSWFRVLRTMTRDAMQELDLPRDPTMRISFPEVAEPEEPNSLTPEELARFLVEMRAHCPHQFALTVLLAYTGLRFCHGSALKWSDWDVDACVVSVMRKQVRGRVGAVSRKKRAPRVLPVLPDLALVLAEHQRRMCSTRAPGFDSGWMFPSKVGKLRASSGLDKAWRKCLRLAGIPRRFTVHGLRYTFTDLIREADVDPIVRRALTGHVTEKMQRHYSTVKRDEFRDAMVSVHALAPLTEVLRASSPSLLGGGFDAAFSSTPKGGGPGGGVPET